MKTIQIKAPAKYIQGSGALNELGKMISCIGKKFLIISNEQAWELTCEKVEAGLKQADLKYVYQEFGGKCTEAEAMLMASKAIEEECSGIVGIGGGKVLDTAKAAAEFAKRPLVLIPTSASSDAPCSAVAVLYHADHSFDRYLNMAWGPEIVVVDTDLIVNAPARLLAAGMADALSTALECDAYEKGLKMHQIETTMSSNVPMLSHIAEKVIRKYGKQAYLDVEQHIHSEAVERVIEANLYVSGVGFQNGGLAAAHSIANALTHIPGLNILHGEAVSVGIIGQLLLEERTEEEIADTEKFLKELGLPTRLRDLPITFSKDILNNLADLAAHSYESNAYLPFDMSAERIAKILAEN